MERLVSRRYLPQRLLGYSQRVGLMQNPRWVSMDRNRSVEAYAEGPFWRHDPGYHPVSEALPVASVQGPSRTFGESLALAVRCGRRKNDCPPLRVGSMVREGESHFPDFQSGRWGRDVPWSGRERRRDHHHDAAAFCDFQLERGTLCYVTSSC